MAEIRLPHVLSDHGVLQRGVPIHIWGWATHDARLTVRFNQQTLATTADKLGEWSVWLQPEKPGGPFALSIAGDAGEGSVTVSDLLVGDVWLASGQSNMEMPLAGWPPLTPLKNGPAEIAAANHPELRLLLVEHKSSDFPVADIAANWQICTPESAAKFSSVAYFFGRALAADQHVPIGLIDSTWGGTPVDAWLSLYGLAANPAVAADLANRALFQQSLAQHDEYLAIDKREDDAAKAAGQPAPTHPWHPDGPSWLPTGLYNGMIAPLTAYSIKGFLWYQGESDTGQEREGAYQALFQGMIQDWRSRFAQGDLPFLICQISSYDGGDDGWGRVRDGERRMLGLSETALIVTSDIGEAHNIHPADKQTVGARLALAARGLVYGEPIAWQGPLFRQAAPAMGGIQVWFDHAQGLTTKDQPLSGFELAGADRHFVKADATLVGDTVLVKSTAVTTPVYVRYDWLGVTPPALYNAAGLPTSTFTSEEDFPPR